MKSKSSTKPIYSREVEGAANIATNAYNAAAPGLAENAKGFANLTGSILSRYGNDPTINAARSHYGDVLSGRYLTGNPELQNIIDMTGNDVANGISAGLGTRGLTGGSAAQGILARELAKNSSNLRYNDYNNQIGRMDNAAASVGNLTNAEGGLLNQAISAYQAQTAPLMAANDYAGTIGGLLGQYTRTKQSGSIGSALATLGGSALSGWASGGFKT